MREHKGNNPTVTDAAPIRLYYHRRGYIHAVMCNSRKDLDDETVLAPPSRVLHVPSRSTIEFLLVLQSPHLFRQSHCATQPSAPLLPVNRVLGQLRVRKLGRK
ncbi:hypothetical protein HBI44_076800 [Parastagonospora nodorum]|nr:hypothetical protein HBH52_047530 [Parastagonospora nodorum]KAH5698880.1 hypothetical protein HBI44_076800 [Parastagonospora nodorum]